MKFIGYESYTSWIITIGSCIIHCTSQTPYRISGLLFVSIVDYYETDRETASIPILTFMIVRCLGGPFCGVLGEKFSAENITFYGSIIAAIGFGGCFFAQNIISLTIFLFIFGIGMTGGNTFIPTIVKKYFNKNINTATGIAQAGSCIGAILIPPITVYLLEKYGLPGTFLIISALMLHAVPVSMIIQKSGLIQDKIVEATKRKNKLERDDHLPANKQKSLHISVDSNIADHKSLSNQISPNSAIIAQHVHVNSQKSPPDSKTKYMREQLSISISNEKSTDTDNFPKSITDSENTFIPEQFSISNQKSLTDSEDTSVSEQFSISNQKSSTDPEDTSVLKQFSMSNHKSYIESEETSQPQHQKYSFLKDNSVQEQLSINNQKSTVDSKNTSKEGPIINQEKAKVSDSIKEKYRDIEIKEDPDGSMHSVISNTHNDDSLSETNCTINNKFNRNQEIDHLNPFENGSEMQQINDAILKPRDCTIVSNIIGIENANPLSDSIQSELVHDTKLSGSVHDTKPSNLVHDTKPSNLVHDTKLSDIENKQISTDCIITPMQSSLKALSISNKFVDSKAQKKSKFHFAKVFINLPFLIIMLSTGLHNFVSILVWTTMIDYSRDKGISRQNEVYFLMIHPFCEIIGRICFGWVTDLGYLTVSRYSMVCFSLMGLTCSCVLLSADFWMMMLGALTFAISTGAMTAVFPGMVFACVPEELQSMAIASRYALSGPLVFTSAPLIGFFRENHGSYDGIYCLMIAICILCVAIMPLMEKYSSRRRKVAT